MVHYRADQVGSLLRPPELLQARKAYQAGTIDREELHRVEDRAIADALEMQRQVGIEVYTDGELRRDAWMSNVADAVDGFVDEHHLMHWHKPDGNTEDEPSRAKIAGAKLRQVRRLTAHEVSFLKQYAPGPFKITLPSPVAISQSGYKPGLSDQAYPTRVQFLEELVGIIRGEMLALVDEGVAYIQLQDEICQGVRLVFVVHRTEGAMTPGGRA